ncbi:YjgB family protein [Paenibacillus albicereus]|uniref:YjgB family protein n=1 Tax=Paenibacillus albicereus TaxID=2726185 RepID=A0A6H2H2Q7_9BACL|nr:YjgB family protein [Paenibacillus albicereus]QJC53618.1 YjgB family protein [Paenibacillus albicereus]
MTTNVRKAALSVLAAAVVAGFGASLPQEAAHAAAKPAAAASASKMAAEKLMAMYKPALQGQFPDFNGFAIGETTRQQVIDAIGKAPEPRKTANGFDVYHAEMGHPGYALRYDGDNVVAEMRYFGTNVERQTNIGGMTRDLLVQKWFMPQASTVFTSAGKQQKKLSYVRGDYQLDFIFNDVKGKDLDHVNLIPKAL